MTSHISGLAPVKLMTKILYIIVLRDRPFNLKGEVMVFFFSFGKFFLGQHENYKFFICRANRNFFFQNLTLGYIKKTLNQIIFFSPPKSEYIFQQHWESEYFFRKKP